MVIGKFDIETPLALAPMAGVTDMAFRELCHSLGADITYTEMISSRALVYQDKKTRVLLKRGETEAPFAIQLFGNSPEVMAKAAKIAAREEGADIIDINMGCPTPKIVNNGDGCALMKTPSLAAEIISAIKNAVDIPVTAKFRKGWDSGSVNAVEFAKTLEAAGADALCIHGRTRVAMYSGRADLDIIRDVKDAVKIPVIANGDVFFPEDAVRMLKYTGADGVMIGRGAFGNPWLFAQARAAINGEEIPPLPSISERLATAEAQILAASRQKGERPAILEARRHISWYLRGLRGAGAYRVRINQISSLSDLSFLIKEMAHVLEQEN